MSKIAVLITPAHYYLDEKTSGSELSWVAQILRGLIDSKAYFLHIVTGYTKNFDLPAEAGQIYQIYRSTDNNQTIFHSLLFTIKKSLRSRALLAREPIEIVHHMLPFAIDTTFDLDFIFRRPDRLYVLGPIQSGQQVASNEEFNFPAAKKFTISFGQRQLVHLNHFLIRQFKGFTRWLSTKTLLAADRIIVITEHTRELLLARGVPADRLVVITPGVDTNHFQLAAKPSRKTKIVELIAVGYLIKRKGFDLLLKVMAELASQKADVHLTIVGDGPQRPALEALAKELKLSSYVSFAGFTPHLETQAHYQAADICLNMSKSESWGQMYLEAMANGLPIISAKQPGSSAIIKDGQFGYLVEQGDIAAMAARVIELVNDPQRRTEMGQRARAEAETVYDWQRVIIPAYLKVYRDLLATRPGLKTERVKL